MTDKINLQPDGACPCGDKNLLLARDQTKFTPVSKAEGEWEYGGDYAEDQDSSDPLGGLRLFCPSCGTYFNVPDELA